MRGACHGVPLLLLLLLRLVGAQSLLAVLVRGMTPGVARVGRPELDEYSDSILCPIAVPHRDDDPGNDFDEILPRESFIENGLGSVVLSIGLQHRKPRC